MTMKEGFTVGLSAGFVCWLISSGYIVFNSAPLMAKGLAIFLAAIMFILSVAVAITSVVIGHAVFDTTGDGFIYGFTVTFDILYILTQLQLGNLPLP